MFRHWRQDGTQTAVHLAVLKPLTVPTIQSQTGTTLSFSSPHLNVVTESIGAIVLDAYTTPRVTTRASTCTPYD